MKSFLIGLSITIIGGLIGGLILSSIQKVNIFNIIVNISMYLFFLIKSFSIWIYAIFFIKIPIWIIIISILSIVLLRKILTHKFPIFFYNTLSNNERIIFRLILQYNEQDTQATLDNILESIKQNKLKINKE